MQARSSIFEIILYPDSLPTYYVDIIEDSKVPCVISPLHQFDTYTEYDLIKEEDNTHMVGELKKPHYHMIVNFGTGANKSIQQVQEIFNIPLKAKKFPKIVNTERGAVRYLIHLDHPNKYQYRLDDIRMFNGYNAGDFFEYSNRECEKVSYEVIEIIKKFDIHTYFELVESVKKVPQYHKYVLSHTISLNAILNSRVGEHPILLNNEEAVKKFADELRKKI